MTYVFSDENLYRQRLLAKSMSPLTDRLLDKLPLGQDIRCLDLGCGIGETTRQLSQKIGQSSEFVGIDIDSDLIQIANRDVAEKCSNITFVEGDVTTGIEFDDESFDFVYARLLLTHLKEPQKVMSEMIRVCKQGGIVAIQDVDMANYVAHPASWVYDRLPELWMETVPDPLIGRKLWSYFCQLGYRSANISVDCVLNLGESTLSETLRLTVEAASPILIAKGLTDAEEIERMKAEFRRIESDSDALTGTHMIFSGWVQR